MAPPRSELRIEKYQRLVYFTRSRFQSIKKSIDEIVGSELTSTQARTLATYEKEVQRRKEAFEDTFDKVINLPAQDENTLDIDNLCQDQEDISELYTYITSRIEPMIETTPSVPDSTACYSKSQVRLPKINLPTFTGDLSNWLSFINLYNATIHSNSSLSNVTRFQYLLGSLEGEALNLIRSLSITEENYIVAYNLLTERYQNDRRLQILHLNNLLDLPDIMASDMPVVRQFLDTYQENTQALKALGHDIQNSDQLLVAVLLRKMDITLRKRLESFRDVECHSKQHTLPTSKEIIDFLTRECNHMEDIVSPHGLSKTRQTNRQIKNSTNHPGTVPRKAMQSSSPSTHINQPEIFCFVCQKSDHNIYSCPALLSQTPTERFHTIKQHGRCISCLRAHNSKNCHSLSSCKKCGKKHHTLLHFGDTKSDKILSSTNTSSEVVSNSKQSSCFTTLLGTLLLKLDATDGSSHVFRALLDSGSMCNLITEHAASLLMLKRHKSSIHLSGIGHKTTRSKGQVYVDIKTLSGQTACDQQPALVLDRLTVDLPRTAVSNEILQSAFKYNLADPTFHLPGRIDVVLGASLFSQVLTNETVSLGQNLPVLLGTRFGYIAMGNAPCLTPNIQLESSSTLNTCLHVTSFDAELHDAMQKFWKQEEPPTRSMKSVEDDLCDKHFATTHYRDKDGRYVISLPFKPDHDELGTSKPAAETRLKAMERKFASNPRFSKMYHDFMQEYLDLGHMSICTEDLDHKPHYYLPHHGVMKESSSTTKLRTVFDASCKTSSGISLNDTLLTGRKLQIDICDLLMHFRQHNIVFCCDIRQMYRQIVVDPNDRNYQLILWRDSPRSPLTTYQLNTVTYGMNSSPYLAIKTLHQLADDEGGSYPLAAHALKHHTYVDDIITGAANETAAMKLQSELVSLLQRGGFELRKWVSNSPSLLNNVPDSHLETPTFLEESQTPQFTVLGLRWSPSIDSFLFNFQIPSEKIPTKRKVLSTLSQIYDPCGFLAPFTMLMKCFMQLMWTKGLSWDERLPTDLASQWKLITDSTHHLKSITIPRALQLNSSCKIELHGFCDASESGFAAVVYLRCLFDEGIVKINPIMAKSRVAPLKRVTIPRLELCAAYLLAQLISHVKSVFIDCFTSKNMYLWSDSTIALTWIQTPPYRLKTFVANRVSQIQELLPTELWSHISSEDNPADCASRGLLPSHLIDHKLWWNGPLWLSLPSCKWPTSKFTPVVLNDPSLELKPNPLTVLTTNPVQEWSLLSKYSSWSTLVRVTVLVMRFINNCRSNERRSGFITTEELQCARLKIFWCVQQTVFAGDIDLLRKHKACSNRLIRLTPFLDKEDLIRVGGRLKLSTLPYDAKHPILLPKRHHVTNILIDYVHILHLHAGPQLVQSIMSQEVWILSARSIIRSRIHQCITCFRHNPSNNVPLMGELPPCRITPAKPFLSTGIDYAGPFVVKTSHLGSRKPVKVYICIFICMVTKAVHIEVATDMTTESFLACLTRFISRRGICSDIHCDCGTNFVGADAALQRIIAKTIYSTQSRDKIYNFTSTQGIKFHFNPPSAPHHGGLWENAIRSAKRHLSKVLGNAVPTLMEFITLTTRIEAMLNSRPLTPLSNDPSDISALTPGHFLAGGPIVLPPEHDVTMTPSNRLHHWQLVQKYHQHIWRRWSTEYLHTLHQRSKWHSPQENIKIGDLVLVHAPSPPLDWPLGRITSVYPGADGIVRVAQIKTATGTIVRPIVKLFPLPLQDFC